MKPIVAIIGRPNVGKSTFFNRVTRAKNAIVDNHPGVTRDRHYMDASWDDVEFTLVDTGGFVEIDQDYYSSDIRIQINLALEDADAVIFMLDGKKGLSPFDADLARTMGFSKVPLFFVVNKIDGIEQEERVYDFYSLGIDKIYSISAEHGYGIMDFLSDLVENLPKKHTSPPPGLGEDTISLAVVGRPNVGKSSLVNKFLGQDRMLVSPKSGTTRDAVDTVCAIDSKPYLLIDTAGIRRKGKVSEKIEKITILKALNSLVCCDVALIVIDAHEGITDQDISIAGYAYDRGCGCIFLLNKWDIVSKNQTGTVRRYKEELRRKAGFLAYAPIMTVSALTGLRVIKIFKQVDKVYDQYVRRVGTGQVNKMLNEAVERNRPPFYGRGRLKFLYATQVSTKPPTFVCFVNYPKGVHFSYKRYLINEIRRQGGFNNTPIRLILRKRKDQKKG